MVEDQTQRLDVIIKSIREWLDYLETHQKSSNRDSYANLKELISIRKKAKSSYREGGGDLEKNAIDYFRYYLHLDRFPLIAAILEDDNLPIREDEDVIKESWGFLAAFYFENKYNLKSIPPEPAFAGGRDLWNSFEDFVNVQLTSTQLNSVSTRELLGIFHSHFFPEFSEFFRDYFGTNSKDPEGRIKNILSEGKSQLQSVLDKLAQTLSRKNG